MGGRRVRSAGARARGPHCPCVFLRACPTTSEAEAAGPTRGLAPSSASAAAMRYALALPGRRFTLSALASRLALMSAMLTPAAAQRTSAKYITSAASAAISSGSVACAVRHNSLNLRSGFKARIRRAADLGELLRLFEELVAQQRRVVEETRRVRPGRGVDAASGEGALCSARARARASHDRRPNAPGRRARARFAASAPSPPPSPQHVRHARWQNAGGVPCCGRARRDDHASTITGDTRSKPTCSTMKRTASESQSRPIEYTVWCAPEVSPLRQSELRERDLRRRETARSRSQRGRARLEGRRENRRGVRAHQYTARPDAIDTRTDAWLE